MSFSRVLGSQVRTCPTVPYHSVDCPLLCVAGAWERLGWNVVLDGWECGELGGASTLQMAKGHASFSDWRLQLSGFRGWGWGQWDRRLAPCWSALPGVVTHECSWDGTWSATCSQGTGSSPALVPSAPQSPICKTQESTSSSSAPQVPWPMSMYRRSILAKSFCSAEPQTGFSVQNVASQYRMWLQSFA